MSAVRLEEDGCVFAVAQIANHVSAPIHLPLRISSRQLRNIQTLTYPQEHSKQIALLKLCQWSIKERISTFRIINQHVQHVAVSPIRYPLPTPVFDKCVLRVYPLKRLPCFLL